MVNREIVHVQKPGVNESVLEHWQIIYKALMLYDFVAHRGTYFIAQFCGLTECLARYHGNISFNIIST